MNTTLALSFLHKTATTQHNTTQLNQPTNDTREAKRSENKTRQDRNGTKRNEPSPDWHDSTRQGDIRVERLNSPSPSLVNRATNNKQQTANSKQQTANNQW